MLLGLGESLEGVVGLLAVPWHYSLLYVLALLLCPLFLCYLHLLPDFSVHFFFGLPLLCLCTPIVSVVVSGHTDPEPREKKCYFRSQRGPWETEEEDSVIKTSSTGSDIASFQTDLSEHRTLMGILRQGLSRRLSSQKTFFFFSLISHTATF